ncbi:MAG TPA: hypothetical protein VF046_06445 [Gemmatimonadales bacterium]
MPIAHVIERHSPELLEIPGVVGVAEGERDRQPVVQILIVRRTPDLLARLPGTLDGYPVVVVESGEIRSQGERGRQADRRTGGPADRRTGGQGTASKPESP